MRRPASDRRAKKRRRWRVRPEIAGLAGSNSITRVFQGKKPDSGRCLECSQPSVGRDRGRERQALFRMVESGGRSRAIRRQPGNRGLRDADEQVAAVGSRHRAIKIAGVETRQDVAAQVVDRQRAAQR